MTWNQGSGDGGGGGPVTFDAVNAALATANAPIDINSQQIVDASDPSQSQDVATKAYVDANTINVHYLEPVKLFISVALPAYTRVVNVITANANGTIPDFDGVTPIINDRVLLTIGASDVDNGVYTITSLGGAGSPWILTRSTDFDESSEIQMNSLLLVTAGTFYSGTNWAMVSEPPYVINVTDITWIQVGQGGVSYTFQSPLSAAGSVVSAPTVEVIGNKGVAGGYAGLDGGALVPAAQLPIGTSAGTVAAGNDSRIVSAVPSSRTITAGTGLTGGGDLTANRSLVVAYGTTAGTSTQGNDARVVGAEQVTNKNQASGYAGLDASSRLAFSQVTGALVQANASVNINNQKIVSLADPTLAQDATTKAYVDLQIQIQPTSGPARAATVIALPAYTRVANVITENTTNGLPTIDGVTIISGDRLLLKNGAAGSDNGVYTVTQAGTSGVAFILTRATDADTSAKVMSGLSIAVTEGSVNAGISFYLGTPDPIVLNTTSLSFLQRVAAGTGLVKTNNTLAVSYGTSAGTAMQGNDTRVVNAVQTSTTITAGAGLTGGGDLSTNRTLDVVANVDGSIVVNANDLQVGVLANDAQHGTRGGGIIHAAVVASGASGFMIGADKAKLDGLPTSVVPTTRALVAGAGLTGGGDLSADRTFDVIANVDGSIIVNANDIQVGVLANDTQHGVRGGGSTHAAVIASGTSGFITGADKAKLDGIAIGAQVVNFANVNTALAAANADININSHKITGLSTPSVGTDASTKAYVDSVAQGLSAKGSARIATTAALAANTYNNGVIGVGATLTANSVGAIASVDGIALAASDRILVKNEATTANNGLYSVTATGSGILPYILTRSLDMDVAAEFPGAFVFVDEGTVNGSSGWVCTADPDTFAVVGTDSVSFTQFSGAGEIIAGTGLTKSGNTISVTTGGITGTLIAGTTITAANIVAGTITDVQVAAANKDGTAGTASMRTLGSGAAQAMAGNSTPTPAAHETTHLPGGSDPIQSASETLAGLQNTSSWMTGHLFLEGDRNTGDNATLSGAMLSDMRQYRDITITGNVNVASGNAGVTLLARNIVINSTFAIDVGGRGGPGGTSGAAGQVSQIFAQAVVNGGALGAGGATGANAGSPGVAGGTGNTNQGGSGGGGGGGGGGNPGAGTNGVAGSNSTTTVESLYKGERIIFHPASISNLTTAQLFVGGGGAAGAAGGQGGNTGGAGGAGGSGAAFGIGAGFVWLGCESLSGAGSIKANGTNGTPGANGSNGAASQGGGGTGGGSGGGAGGLIVIKANSISGVTLQANGGTGGAGGATVGTGGTGSGAGGLGQKGGDGGAGRIIQITL